MPDVPALPALMTLPRAAFAGALGVATAVRGRRVFHPKGQTHLCRLLVSGGDWGARLLDEAAVHDGVVRLSRGIGLPQPLPDVDGLALRLPGLGIGGAPLDLLVNSAWRFAFAPSVLSPTWSCVLPYRTGDDRQVLIGARPRTGGFTLLAAPLLGRWEVWGHLELQEQVDGEDLGFAPTIGAQDLRPVPFLRALRGQSYNASQAARSALTPPARSAASPARTG